MMSRRRVPSTLGSLCLQNIAHNMQSIWVSDYSEKYLEEYNFLYIEGPFNQLSGAMVQELLRILGESHKLTRASLHLLLQPHLTELSLRPCAGLVSNAITQLVTVRCKFLTCLDMHSCQRVPAASLALLLEGLPMLVKLCLSDTHCDTGVLSVIGSCCPRLRELDISHCKKLTPSSMLHLAYDPIGSTFCCQALKVLLVEDLKQKGSLAQWVHTLCFLLLAMPRLERLSNSLLLNALRLLHSGKLNECGSSPAGFPSLSEVGHARLGLVKGRNGLSRVGNSPSELGECPAKGGCHVVQDGKFENDYNEGTLAGFFRLTKLEDVEEEDLPLVRYLCHKVEEVDISLGNLSGVSWDLAEWRHLSHLTLHCSGFPSRSLEDMLASLETVGSRLRYLSLQNIFWHQASSLHALLSLCPNLHTFLSHCTPRCHALSRNDPEEVLPPWGENLMPLPFPHLESFSLLLEGGDPLNTVFKHSLGGSLVSLLCGSPKLETLSLWEVPVLLDAVFEVTFGSITPPPLQRLRSASLCRSSITSWGASLVIRSDNDLDTLDLSHCHDVTLRDHIRLQEMARKEGKDITIIWQ
ncbi:uncharacterized protein O3C94_020019 [Discoglossus pictus]